MAFKQITSPHAHAAQNTTKVMQLVLWATVPGLAALTIQFGWGSLINVVLAVVTSVICEAAIIKLRKRPVAFYLRDYSAAVTAVLLGLALPPLGPWRGGGCRQHVLHCYRQTALWWPRLQPL